MLADFLQGLDLSHWETWAAPVAGVGCAGLLLLLARMWRAQKQTATMPPAKESVPHQEVLESNRNGERRANIRRGGKTVTVLISDAEAKAEPFTGRVRDRSIGGLRIESTRPVDINTILSVRTADDSGNTSWVQVEVKRCHPREGKWELGCQFVRTPPYSQLLLFG
jgi:PilZ domain